MGKLINSHSLSRHLPDGPVRIHIILECFGRHLNAVARLLGGEITAVTQANRIDKMLVQMIGKLNHPVRHTGADAHIIKHLQMLHILTQPHATRMGTDGNAKLAAKR